MQLRHFATLFCRARVTWVIMASLLWLLVAMEVSVWSQVPNNLLKARKESPWEAWKVDSCLRALQDANAEVRLEAMRVIAKQRVDDPRIAALVLGWVDGAQKLAPEAYQILAAQSVSRRQAWEHWLPRLEKLARQEIGISQPLWEALAREAGEPQAYVEKKADLNRTGNQTLAVCVLEAAERFPEARGVAARLLLRRAEEWAVPPEVHFLGHQEKLPKEGRNVIYVAVVNGELCSRELDGQGGESMCISSGRDFAAEMEELRRRHETQGESTREKWKVVLDIRSFCCSDRFNDGDMMTGGGGSFYLDHLRFDFLSEEETEPLIGRLVQLIEDWPHEMALPHCREIVAWALAQRPTSEAARKHLNRLAHHWMTREEEAATMYSAPARGNNASLALALEVLAGGEPAKALQHLQKRAAAGNWESLDDWRLALALGRHVEPLAEAVRTATVPYGGANATEFRRSLHGLRHVPMAWGTWLGGLILDYAKAAGERQRTLIPNASEDRDEIFHPMDLARCWTQFPQLEPIMIKHLGTAGPDPFGPNQTLFLMSELCQSTPALTQAVISNDLISSWGFSSTVDPLVKSGPQGKEAMMQVTALLADRFGITAIELLETLAGWEISPEVKKQVKTRSAEAAASALEVLAGWEADSPMVRQKLREWLAEGKTTPGYASQYRWAAAGSVFNLEREWWPTVLKTLSMLASGNDRNTWDTIGEEVMAKTLLRGQMAADWRKREEALLQELGRGSKALQASPSLRLFAQNTAKPFSVGLGMQMLENSYLEPAERAKWLGAAYLCTDHGHLVEWLGNHQDPKPVASVDKTSGMRRMLIDALRPAIGPSRQFPTVQSRLAKVLSQLVREGEWVEGDGEWLKRMGEELLMAGAIDEGQAIQHKAMALRQPPTVREPLQDALRWVGERLQEPRTWGVGSVSMAAVHAGLWLFVLLVYPRSARAQAWFLGNSRMRRLMGAGYVDAGLFFFKPVRERLFKPMREWLVPRQDRDLFDPDAFFDEVEVVFTEGGKKVTRTTAELFRPVKGQALVIAPSGLGKTTLMRALWREQGAPVALVRAAAVGKDVAGAVLERLEGSFQENPFLKRLIRGGLLTIFIDGLNEAPQETRRRICQYLNENPGGNFLVTTQPLDPTRPLEDARLDHAREYHLQPLRKDQVEAFLRKQWAHVADSAKGHGIQQADYEAACTWLAHDTRAKAGAEGNETGGSRLVAGLRSPLDAVMAAELLAEGVPAEALDLGQIIGHHREKFEALYEERQLMPFPWEAFGRALLKWAERPARVLELKEGEKESFEKEVELLAEARLVIRRHDGKHLFRHERIRDHFLSRAMRRPEVREEAARVHALVPVHGRMAAHLTESEAAHYYFFLVRKLEEDKAYLEAFCAFSKSLRETGKARLVDLWMQGHTVPEMG